LSSWARQFELSLRAVGGVVSPAALWAARCGHVALLLLVRCGSDECGSGVGRVRYVGLMTTSGEMTLTVPTVTVVLYLGPPRHYVARLGVTGWSEAWGWSEAEALTNLARLLIADSAEHLPPSLVGRLAGVIAWLQSGYDLPILEPWRLPRAHPQGAGP